MINRRFITYRDDGYDPFDKLLTRGLHYLICLYLMISCIANPYLNESISIIAIGLSLLIVPFALHKLLILTFNRTILLILLMIVIPSLVTIFYGQFELVDLLFLFKSFFVPAIFLTYAKDKYDFMDYMHAIMIGSFVTIIAVFIFAEGYSIIGTKNGISQQLLYGLYASLIWISLKTKYIKTVILIYIVLLFLAILIIGSRSALFTAISSILLFLIMRRSYTTPKLFIRLSIYFSLVYAAITLFFEKLLSFPTIYRIIGLFQPDNYVSSLGKQGIANLRGEDRINIYLNIWKLFQDRPWFGYGFVGFNKYSNNVYTHSAYLELIFTGGIITLLIFIALLLTAIINIYNLNIDKRLNHKLFKSGFIACLCGLIINSLFYPIYYTQLNLLFLLAVLPPFSHILQNNRQEAIKLINRPSSINIL